MARGLLKIVHCKLLMATIQVYSCITTNNPQMMYQIDHLSSYTVHLACMRATCYNPRIRYAVVQGHQGPHLNLGGLIVLGAPFVFLLFLRQKAGGVYKVGTPSDVGTIKP